jgi:hypothetical protein
MVEDTTRAVPPFHLMGQDSRASASELRCVAPLVGGATPQLVGPCTLVTNGVHTIAFASAELLRQAGEPLAILTKLDGSSSIPVAQWSMARHAAIGIIDVGQATQFSPEITPLHVASVCATVDTRGAPSALVAFRVEAGKIVRYVISVHVDAVDGGGMSDEVISRLASPMDAADVDAAIEGAPLFTWMPPDPVLGRKSEIVVVALGVMYRARTFKPREQVAIAELVGLEDLGRALPWAENTPPPTNELGQVAGEIRDDETGPLAGFDLDREE